ncbi:MAG: histidine phosphatase family protein [Leptothrix ochracea]|uniref:SixA phosphatase family protein n=1 Tax=Leptothrix ochracea TaxID=735331 RepID=UPI0034E28FC7
MTLDLIFWRHAEAHDAVEGGSDLLRALTPHGEQQAARMAVWLNRHLPADTRILASPARRTEQTVLALDRPFKLHAELAPTASLAQLLTLTQGPNLPSTVLIVGHQPTLGQAIGQLIGAKAGACCVKKGAVWWLRQRQRGGVPQTVLVSVQSPGMLPEGF